MQQRGKGIRRMRIEISWKWKQIGDLFLLSFVHVLKILLVGVIEYRSSQGNPCAKYSNSGIYCLRCGTCDKIYVGQTGRNLKRRFLEHHRYIKTNDPKSTYALHILNRHEYGPLHTTVELLKPCNKGWCMNYLENSYIQSYQLKGSLIHEQNLGEINPLLAFIFNQS